MNNLYFKDFDLLSNQVLPEIMNYVNIHDLITLYNIYPFNKVLSLHTFWINLFKFKLQDYSKDFELIKDKLNVIIMRKTSTVCKVYDLTEFLIESINLKYKNIKVESISNS